MRIKDQIIIAIALFFCLSTIKLVSQNNALVINGAYIMMNGGSAGSQINLVVNQTSTAGIVVIGGGYINSESQYNVVKWITAAGTGSYVFPFGKGGVPTDYIPFTFNKTNGNSDISVSTWSTTVPNLPYPTLTNVGPVTTMAGLDAVDRFWDIQAPGTATADLNFSYLGSENTTLIPSDTLKPIHWNGTSWDNPVGPGNHGVTVGVGTSPATVQSTFSPWTLVRIGFHASNSTSNTQNVGCNGQCTGSATASFAGGLPPYTYTWSTTPPQSAQTATGLCVGVYTVNAQDANGTPATQTVSISQPPPIQANASQTNVKCNGNANGSATVTPTGGTPTYTVTWNTSPVQTSSVATGLQAGVYTATITDSHTCSIVQTVTITQPGVLSDTVLKTNVTCYNGTNGSATVIPSGGTPSYTVTWNTSPVQTSSVVTGLAAGNYNAVITDANGCPPYTQTVTISQPPAITITPLSSPAKCNSPTGSASVTASGGTPAYTYTWLTSGATGTTQSGLAPGVYTVNVTDANLCPQSQTLAVNSINPLSALVSSSSTACQINNGTATVSAFGGGTYNYNWNSVPSQTTQVATGLGAGVYTVTVTDNASGCSNTQTVNITQTPGPTVSVVASHSTITLGENVQLTASASPASGITYSWTLVKGLSCYNCNNPTATPTQTTSYCVKVKDANNCADSTCITINVDIPCGEVFIPNAFSPNDDGANEKVCVMGNCIKDIYFVIYDRWGEKVWESSDPANTCWDGIYKGAKMNTAVFVYYMKATLSSGEQITKKGNISLLR